MANTNKLKQKTGSLTHSELMKRLKQANDELKEKTKAVDEAIKIKRPICKTWAKISIYNNF